jgi:uncharacterized RDD family membrane protein YckC
MPNQSFPNPDPSDRKKSKNQGRIRTNLYPVPAPGPDSRTGSGCPQCGVAIEPDAQFCVSCGLNVASFPDAGLHWLKARPWLPPRLAAELIDRLFPFMIAPFISLPLLLIGWNGFFWTWLSIVFLWHLLRDCSANRRSLGKWWFRLRVVSTIGRKRAKWRQAVGRRFFSTLSQSAYCVAIAAFVIKLRPLNEIPWPWPFFVNSAKTLLLLAFAYDVVSLASILISDGGRRVEDFISRTRVVREAAYTRDRKKCSHCGVLILKNESFCGRCGERNAPKTTIRLVD